MAYEARLAEALTLAAPAPLNGFAVCSNASVCRSNVPRSRRRGSLARNALDKKTRSGAVRFALPQTVGKMCGDDQQGWTVAAPEELVREVLAGIP